jgi:signal transduction histidine kinase
VYAAYRYRLSKFLEVERLRLRISDDLHDDIGSNLSTIALISRAVQRAPDMTATTRQKLAEIYDTAVATSDGMKDIVWLIKPENDTLQDLLLRMKDTASSLLAGVEINFDTPRTEHSLRIGIDFKRNVFLAFKEILNNIAKHSMATRVNVHIAFWDGTLEMNIGDNGKGFEESATHRGNGLKSIRRRAQNVHGTCDVASRPGHGTTVRFSGKL